MNREESIEVITVRNEVDTSSQKSTKTANFQEVSHHNEIPQLENSNITINSDDDCCIVISNNTDCNDIEDHYDPFSNNSRNDIGENSHLNTLVGPFADDRPICECDTIKQLMARTETRYLLSLLPDMAEMNPHQKLVFKEKVLQIIDNVLTNVS
uniref:BESS domain-containing protein n=1 Tax=Cuerna arida TaxID=1464854 RepID=A0A1B6GIP0_9HEMI